MIHGILRIQSTAQKGDKQNVAKRSKRQTNLGVSDNRNPVRLLGAWHAQHRPEEDGDRKQQREDAARHEGVEYHGKVAENGRVREKHFTEGDEQAQHTRHVHVETLLRHTTRNYPLIFIVHLSKAASNSLYITSHCNYLSRSVAKKFQGPQWQ